MGQEYDPERDNKSLEGDTSHRLPRALNAKSAKRDSNQPRQSCQLSLVSGAGLRKTTHRLPAPILALLQARDWEESTELKRNKEVGMQKQLPPCRDD
jgi:hypothetical protein